MDLNYTSAHARVFEGVRTARFRALTDFRTGTDGHGETCRYEKENPGHEYCDRIAEGLWVQAPSGAVTPLCRRHLDAWSADCYRNLRDEPHPPVIVPLFRRSA